MGLADLLRHYTSDRHKAVEQRPFVARYRPKYRRGRQDNKSKKTTDLTPSDHYVHLVQLRPIYRALEKQLDKCRDQEPVAHFLDHEILNRSEKIESDIQFLINSGALPQQFVDSEKQGKPPLNEATKLYAKDLANCDKPITLLAHFCVRILGDGYGGQALANYVNYMYKRNHIKDSGDQDKHLGTAFYDLGSSKGPQLSYRLNQLSLTAEDENIFLQQSQLAFDWHANIFAQCEVFRQSHSHLFVHHRERQQIQDRSVYQMCQKAAPYLFFAAGAGLAVYYYACDGPSFHNNQ